MSDINIPDYNGYSLGEPFEEGTVSLTSRHYGINCPLLTQLKKVERPTIDDGELIRRYKEGDLSASYLLLVKHYKYILKRILEITQGHWFSEDILQAGAVGLFEAAKRFDPNKGYTFLTYAHSWILKYIYIEVRNELLPMGGIGMGRDAKEKLFNFIKLTMQGKTDSEIMTEMKISKKKLDELKIMNVTAAQIRSLDKLKSEESDDESSSIYNFVDSKAPSPEDESIASALQDFIEKQLKDISSTDPMLGKILSMKLGLCGEMELTKQEICDKLNIKNQEYTKLERAGNKILRTRLIEAGWYDKA